MKSILFQPQWYPLRIFPAVVLLLTGLAVAAAEQLDRGVAAFRRADGRVYVGWRLLAGDPPDVSFDVYRAATPTGRPVKLNRPPITASTDFVDTTADGKNWFYSVRARAKGERKRAAELAGVDEAGPVGGVRKIRFQGNYTAQKVGLADLDGDGKLDFIIKQPDFNSDPYQIPTAWKPSPEPYKIEAYRHDGEFLWRYDMGWAIETGVWYSPIVVYDLDGDGKAEVYCKAGPPGDPRNARGAVVSGPEHLVKLDGQTGKVLARLDWPDRSGMGLMKTPDEPDYNYWSRNFLAVAYLDGRRPHLIVQRGTYSLIKIRAYDPQLNLVRGVETKGEYEAYKRQGTHGIQIADIDEDGRDELVIGAAAIDDNGKPLWTTGRGHPDVCYVGDIDPDRPGLEIFYGHEYPQKTHGVCLVEARTGRTIWGYDGPTTHVHAQGMVADIDPTRPGLECYAGEKDGSNFWLYDARGTRISNESFGNLSPRAAWWTERSHKVIVSQGRMFEFNGSELGQLKGTIIGIADCLGDWREEILISVAGELQIHSTTIPAKDRRLCLMQDRQYRTAVATQTMGYFYPPIPSGRLLPGR